MKNAQSKQRAAVRVVIITKHSGHESKCSTSAAQQSLRFLIVWSEKKDRNTSRLRHLVCALFWPVVDGSPARRLILLAGMLTPQ